MLSVPCAQKLKTANGRFITICSENRSAIQSLAQFKSGHAYETLMEHLQNIITKGVTFVPLPPPPILA